MEEEAGVSSHFGQGESIPKGGLGFSSFGSDGTVSCIAALSLFSSGGTLKVPGPEGVPSVVSAFFPKGHQARERRGCDTKGRKASRFNGNIIYI